MVKLNYLVFGYRRLTVDPVAVERVTTLLIRAGVFSSVFANGSIIVKESDYLKIKGILSGRVDYSASETLGLYGKIKRMRHKCAIAFSIFISIALLFLSSRVVWDIRVSGNEKIPSSKIVLALSDCGFGVGSSWARTDLSEIETKMQLNPDYGISWINLNRRGTVCYVTVIEDEAKEKDEVEQELRYANIVASSDCVIEEIRVGRGTAAVKAGDTVKKGDVLIFGFVSGDQYGEFCRAEGSVVGRISDSISVVVAREEQIRRQESGKICSVDINFFNFSINIFKLYGNLTNNCDIIENVKSYSLFGKCTLPIFLRVKYLPRYRNEGRIYTDGELTAIAAERLNSLVATRLELCDLVRLSTSGQFTDEGYEMRSDMIFCESVGELMEFTVE